MTPEKTEQPELRYTLRHEAPATRITGTPTSDRLRRFYQEHEAVILPVGTRFDLATDPSSVGSPATLLVLTDNGWFRAKAADLTREPWDTEYRDIYQVNP